MSIRRLGVWGYNLVPKTATIISPADMKVAGIAGRFSRGIESVIDVFDDDELDVKVGGYNSAYYGRYVADSFFANLGGIKAVLKISMYVASDAVQAYSSIQDSGSTPDDTLKIKAGYKGKIDKSADGNNTGYKIIHTARSQSKATATASSGGTSVTVSSVAGFVVGSLLKIVGSSTHYAVVTAIDEANKILTTTALDSAIAIDDIMYDWGFKIECYRKNSIGMISKVNIPENKEILSMESTNVDYYVNNVFDNHPYLILEDLLSSNNKNDKLPPETSDIVFLANGSDGSSPSSVNDWSPVINRFNNHNIRMFGVSDTTMVGVNLYGENYAMNRLDSPIFFYNIPADLSEDELKELGRSYQRSDQVQGIITAGWRNMYANIAGSNQKIKVPNIGAQMGAWIRTMFTRGVHHIPAETDIVLKGFAPTPNAIEDEFDDDARTRILEAGVNIIANVNGSGLLIRNFRTPSTNTGALWGHYLLLQNFIKISSVESLKGTENKPLKMSKLKEYGELIRDFCFKLYEGSYPFGIDQDGAFGDYEKDDGSLSSFDDVIEIQADRFNNDPSELRTGQGNIFVRFYPAPVEESLAIGVGVMIPIF